MRGFSRGPIYQAPVSQVATWSGRLGLFAFAVALLSIIIVRTRLPGDRTGARHIRGRVDVRSLAILLAFAAFVVIWRQGNARARRAGRRQLLLGILLLAYPGYLGYRALQAAGDQRHHHRCRQPAALRRAWRGCARAAPVTIPARVAQLQRAAYPDIEPLRYDAPAADRLQDRARGRHQREVGNILDTASPRARAAGTIEAVARTLNMGFRDDVVVPSRKPAPVRASTCAQLRATGTHDFGANARRV